MRNSWAVETNGLAPVQYLPVYWLIYMNRYGKQEPGKNKQTSHHSNDDSSTQLENEFITISPQKWTRNMISDYVMCITWLNIWSICYKFCFQEVESNGKYIKKKSWKPEASIFWKKKPESTWTQLTVVSMCYLSLLYNSQGKQSQEKLDMYIGIKLIAIISRNLGRAFRRVCRRVFVQIHLGKAETNRSMDYGHVKLNLPKCRTFVP